MKNIARISGQGSTKAREGVLWDADHAEGYGNAARFKTPKIRSRGKQSTGGWGAVSCCLVSTSS
ncbi:MAG: hypothetical protein ACKORJ_11345 [Bacteroidota bacterium]